MKTIKYLLIILVLFCFISISCTKKQTKEPTRPKNVPMTAFWCGGPDGGSWIEIKGITNKSYHLVVYNDNTGEIEKDGMFQVSDKQFNKEELQQLMSGFDGKRIILNKYLTLESNK